MVSEGTNAAHRTGIVANSIMEITFLYVNRFHILKIALLIEIVVLVFVATMVSKDYQDSWVLEGLEPYFIVFMITYAVTFFFEKRTSQMVLLAVVCIIVMTLLPNLKYFWFLGREIDQQGQYRLAAEVYNNGHIATQFHGGHAEVYVNTPLIHLSFAMFSIVLNIPVMYSMKFLPILLSTLIPMLTYSVMKNLKFPNEGGVLKCALFVSSMPFRVDTYVITGRTFGTLLAFLILSQIIRLNQERDRRQWSIMIFLVIALAAAHSTSSLLFATTLLAIGLSLSVSSKKFLEFKRMKFYLKSTTILITIITLAWLTFSGTRQLNEIVGILPDMLSAKTPTTGYIPSRFFELLSKSIFGALRSVIVYGGADFFLLFFAVIGLIFILKNIRQHNNALKFLFLFNAILLGFLGVGIAMKIGEFFLTRVLDLMSISFPVLFSVSIVYLIKRKALRAVVLLSLVFLISVQFYRCQPLIPMANTISEDLPANEPIVYTVEVNSIYQRQMIDFAEEYVKGRIASDRLTTNQVIGLTSFNFSANLIWYYPIASLVDENIVKIRYDYFLIHLPGKSGAFSEQAEMRTTKLIYDTIKDSTIIYTNGESYICVPHVPAS
jgi:hypothetical protein